MIGIVLGLGFQWWPNLHEPWQYIAFIFVYIDIVDYWMDYGPSLKKFPPKREIDVMLDVAIMFALFLYIYTTQLSLTYFFGAFILTRILDYFWLLSSKQEYQPSGVDAVYINSWLRFNLIESVTAGFLFWIALSSIIPVLTILLIFIGLRVIIRILASWQYKKIHFV
ncbi:MAG: hypothetical protein A2664_01390 [Candidatus Taylorbacteria bacterium RIFCSPHIGHO2_01_FULL_46_22b]|uniref:Uncharacterized protein n=1 Tax=Candidatus Taylorbacteria bacterium RIFCSPHIGHO2_01_FULL_46_22b TaxID=1802301 RepID=A0A1G2M2H9_9BACT|nr:MAG: hypothetical protein A2664_01390 [Candidatus Taylorbacteria bacterium RIFCSPHIGHO2_01_FULL_46_22b]